MLRIVIKILREIIRISGMVAIIGCSVAPVPSFAGSAGIGSIITVFPHSQAGLFFEQTGTRVSPPTCATQAIRWVIDVTTSQGQAMVAALLTAQSRGKRISIQGTGDCEVWGDTETVLYFIIED